MTVISAVLFGLGVLISTSMTTTADGQAVVDQEKINRQLEQALKALDSGDIASRGISGRNCSAATNGRIKNAFRDSHERFTNI